VKSAQAKPLDGLSVLLVEDQSLIALDMEATLLDLGAQSVQTYTGRDAALAWLATSTPDVGVLDVNLGSSDAFPIAFELHQRRIPFVFTTGYDDNMRMPVELADAPVLRKPYSLDDLRLKLRACLGLDQSET
jgi:DNA-binding response OmpR family regulator